MWVTGLGSGGQNSFAANRRRAFTAYACHAVALDLVSGDRDWTFSQGCEGGHGETPSLYRGVLYARDLLFGNVTLRADRGVPTGTFSSGPPPAFSGSIGFFTLGDVVQAVHLPTRTIMWATERQGQLLTGPIVVGDHVFVASADGTVLAIRARTGKTIWTKRTGHPVQTPPEQFSQVHTGLGAGEGLLIVPGVDSLTAFRSR